MIRIVSRFFGSGIKLDETAFKFRNEYADMSIEELARRLKEECFHHPPISFHEQPLFILGLDNAWSRDEAKDNLATALEKYLDAEKEEIRNRMKSFPFFLD